MRINKIFIRETEMSKDIGIDLGTANVINIFDFPKEICNFLNQMQHEMQHKTITMICQTKCNTF